MFSIRQYQDEDAAAVWQLHREALQSTGAYFYSGQWEDDLHAIWQEYLDSGGEFLVGLWQQQIVAMGALQPMAPGQAKIKRMRVAPAFQRRGFGQQILEALEARAAALGYTQLFLDTTLHQTASQRLYLRNSYIEVRRDTREGIEFLYYEKSLA